MLEDTRRITDTILEAREKAMSETSDMPEPAFTQQVDWPVSCTVGPGLEGAIACESEVGYVNGSKGWLIYRGYDIFDLCAHCTFEEVSFLLLHGSLPNKDQLAEYRSRLILYAHMPNTIRRIMSFPLENMHAMAALRLATNLMRQEFTHRDQPVGMPDLEDAIGSDEDSIPMETEPWGDARAIYEFHRRAGAPEFASPTLKRLVEGSDMETCYHLVSGVSTLTAAIARIRSGQLPIEPDPGLGHAANFLYMLSGKRPSPVAERLMDVALILHADHGMNASTFAAMVVASTLSDIYLSVGSGIAALSGPLHGGANEKVIDTLREIGSVENVKPWFERARAEKRKVMGFGHRVYKAYDPRARVLGPLNRQLADSDPEVKRLFEIAEALEGEVVSTLGAEKNIFPNVDFYSGLTFTALGIEPYLFAPIFAVSRVAGWTARVLEYLNHNRIFRPRAIYVGPFGRKVEPIENRG